MKLVIKKPRGIASRTSSAHEYKLPTGDTIRVISKRLNETRTVLQDEAVSGRGVYADEVKVSTVYMVNKIKPDTPDELIYSETIEGDGDDERCLSLLGYYLADYDELQEARKIKRLIDLAKFVDVP